RVLRFLCPYSGWYLPMFVAGAIEKVNVWQYDCMAADAADLGNSEMAATLSEMAAVERRHAAFFASALSRRHSSRRTATVRS
ncbi:MAG: ferritin family protein, partial [Acidobacteriota bacterium]